MLRKQQKGGFGMRRIFRASIIMVICAFMAMVASMSAARALTQTTDTDTNTNCTWSWTRVIPQSHQEYKYEKTVAAIEGVKEYKYKKLIEGTEAGPDLWWVWAPNDTKGPQDYEPVFPEDDRGKWVGPKENGGPRQDTFGTFQTSNNGNSNWFHREHGTPGTEDSWEESEWTTEVRGEPWILIDERWKVEPVPAQTVKYNDGNWTTDTPGEPWVKVDERTVQDKSINQGPVRSADEPDRGEYPDVPWTKVPGSEECDTTPPPVCYTDNPNREADTMSVRTEGENPSNWLSIWNANNKADQSKIGDAVNVGEDCKATIPMPPKQCKPQVIQWDVSSTEPPSHITDIDNDGIADIPGFIDGGFVTIPGDESLCEEQPPADIQSVTVTTFCAGFTVQNTNGEDVLFVYSDDPEGMPEHKEVNVPAGKTVSVDTSYTTVYWAAYGVETDGLAGQGTFGVKQDCEPPVKPPVVTPPVVTPPVVTPPVVTPPTRPVPPSVDQSDQPVTFNLGMVIVAAMLLLGAGLALIMRRRNKVAYDAQHIA
ncbi:MAG: hypothetical protein ABIQ64_00445 [Candidatus Saccharimonadales bacterium]